MLHIADKITSTHRGHGESLAKGTVAIREMSDEQLGARVPHCKSNKHEELLEAALEQHVYRMICELFGKEDGYCKGRGGSMHIADFTVGHLGANAIVGGGVPIATGAAIGLRYQKKGRGGLLLRRRRRLRQRRRARIAEFRRRRRSSPIIWPTASFGLPMIFLITNNHYGMTHRTDDEVMGVSRIARRAAGFADNNMHAEIVNGMDPLAVRDAVLRAAEICRKGEGPVLLDCDTYRYWGHSLSDPRNEYRTKEEEAAWKSVDPIERSRRRFLRKQGFEREGTRRTRGAVRDRNARAAKRAAAAADPAAEDVIKYMFTDTKSETVPAEFAKVEIIAPRRKSSASTAKSPTRTPSARR